ASWGARCPPASRTAGTSRSTARAPRASSVGDDGHRETANRLIAYHSPIALALTTERTSLESRLIPVSAYVVTACVEAYLRYPDLVAAIEAALPAEEIGRRARRPGSRVNTVHLWGVPNFHLLGRKVLAMVDP